MSVEKRCQEFEARLHQAIPISAHMGARIQSIRPQGVVVSAPLAPNSNHKNTAFGGSLHAVAVLSCWVLVATALEDAGIDSEYIVIQDSQIEYLQPVDGDFVAESNWLSSDARESFLKMLKRKGLARIQLQAQIIKDGNVYARLTGRFVAQTRPASF